MNFEDFSTLLESVRFIDYRDTLTVDKLAVLEELVVRFPGGCWLCEYELERADGTRGLGRVFFTHDSLLAYALDVSMLLCLEEVTLGDLVDWELHLDELFDVFREVLV